MKKSIFSDEYAFFLQHLRAARKTAGITQEQLAEILGQTQSFVSKVERGERRLDIVELRAFCRALKVSYSDFVTQIDELLTQKETNL